MLHPLYSTVLDRPDLVGDHLAAYGALIRDEVALAGRGWVARVVALAVVGASAALALGLAGVAVMLGVLHGTFHWVLVAVPGVAAVVAVLVWLQAARPAGSYAFDELRAQIDADLAALQLSGRTPP